MSASPRWRRNQRLKCSCDGYHFPHRRAGGACEHSASCNYHRALRMGATDAALDFWIDLTLTARPPRKQLEGCPF